MSHLFLTGFMGAGKSTVGRLVAERLGWRFVDLDAEIERREGSSVAGIFRSAGEPGFRDAEHAALEAVLDGPPAVVATGGGAVLREDNQALLRERGTVVYLAVSPEEAMARIGDAGDRPLLAGGGLAAARSVLSARLSTYQATADHVIDTVGKRPEEVAAAVVTVAGAVASHVRVSGAPGYDIVIGRGLLAQSGIRIAMATRATRAALVTDDTVAGRYAAGVAAALGEAGIACTTHVVPAGEPSKSWEQAGRLLEEFAAAGLDRASAVVALGGGVVGDLAGFCASAYMRGVALVQLPTTLLAQVDSAIGGKTGVDLAAGKNLAGTFWPPRLVLSDTAVLETLPDAEWTNGLVEAAKAAVLAGSDALEAFEGATSLAAVRDPAAVERVVRDASAFKAAIVSEDLRESGTRECLNLGHTLGHALESLGGYGAVPHGLAVAEGMVFAAGLAATDADADPALPHRIDSLLESVGAGAVARAAVVGPVARGASAAALLGAMRSDKKSRDGVVRFVLPLGPGRWVARGVDDGVLLSALEAWRSGLAEGGA